MYSNLGSFTYEKGGFKLFLVLGVGLMERLHAISLLFAPTTFEYFRGKADRVEYNISNDQFYF